MINNVSMMNFSQHGNSESGILTAYEKNSGVPFEIKRVYTVTGAPENQKRGYHAHRKLQQIFIALSGEIEVYCEDWLGNKESYLLSTNGEALYCGAGVWHTLSYRNHAVLLVLADDSYQESDYIREYDVFLQEEFK